MIERLRGRRELHVGLGDATDAARDELHLHFVGGELGQRFAQRLGAALHVGLDEHRRRCRPSASPICENTSSARVAWRRQLHVAELALAVQRDLARLALALDGEQLVARIRRAGQTQHHAPAWRARPPPPACRSRRTCARTRPNSEPAMIGSPSLQRALLHEHGRDGAAALLDARLDHDAGGEPVARCAQLQHFGLQQDGLEQLIDALRRCAPRRCTNMFSPPQSSGMTSCLASSVRTRSGSASGLSILLTATTIGTPAARACWIASMVCGMTPSSAATTSTTTSVAFAPRARIAVKAAWPGVSRKVMHALRRLHVVGADVLRDAAGFARGHLGAADVVEQRGLAVIDVTHDGDDRRTRLQVLGRRLRALQVLLDLVLLEHLRRVAHLLDHEHRGVLIDRLVDGRHDAHVHQDLDDFGRLDRHLLRELRDGDGLADADFAHDRRGRHLEAMLAVAADCGIGTRP